MKTYNHYIENPFLDYLNSTDRVSPVQQQYEVAEETRKEKRRRKAKYQLKKQVSR